MTENKQMTREERQRRTFSENFKRKKVLEVESRQCKIGDICRQYQVAYVTVYRWLEKYGTMKSRKERLIIETESDTKKLIALQKRVAELEQVIGQKQLVIDFQEKMIELAEEEYKVDIKKKFITRPSDTTTTTEKNVQHH